MRPQYLGDSFDIVKQSLLRWLSGCGTWVCHPMFTETVSAEQADILSRLLGVRLLSSGVLETETDRGAYFAVARSCVDHLFLDPDTGLKLEVDARKDHPSYLFGPEVISIVRERPELLTLVFDQSLARGRESEQLQVKLDYLYNAGIASAAYVSHACFILMGVNKELSRAHIGHNTDRFGIADE